MPPDPVRAVFMGSDDFSLPVMRALLERGGSLRAPVRLVGVITQPDRPAGRGRKVTAAPVKRSAEVAGLPVVQPARVRDPAALEEIAALRPELVVVASYGQIIPRALLELPRHRSLNLHPSLLPKHRGPSPLVGAILGGDTVTGVTLMLMTSKMDAGPIVSQRETSIGPEETAGELTDRLADLSAELLLDCLPDWLEGRLHPEPQDEAQATYTRLMTKADGMIDWSRPASELARKVRAFNPWPVAFSLWQGRQLRVWRASARAGTLPPGLVARLEDGSIAAGTGNGLLTLSEVQLEGGRPLDADTLVRGHPALVGSELGR